MNSATSKFSWSWSCIQELLGLDLVSKNVLDCICI
jgi:hypothetical protein